MPRNGSGTYTRPQSDYVPGTTILATSVNSDLNDMAQALTASIARDGQTIPTANLPMGNFRHTGASDGSARTDYATLGQTQNGAFLWAGTAGGTANAATVNLNPPLAAYAAGQAFRFIASAANTGAVTLNVNSLGALALNKGDGTVALTAGDIPSGALVTVQHDGTRFRLIDAGVGVFAAGTAALPGLAVSGDPDTGIFSPVANQLAVSAGGIQFVTVLNNAVGIGLSNPGYPFTVQANSSAQALRLVGRAADDISTMEFGNSAQSVINSIIQSGPGYLSFGPSGTEQARVDNTGAFRFNSGYGSAALAFGCRAWVNFNGTGTVAIRASGNVSSITDNGTGDYTVNFSTNMPNANYCVIGVGSSSGPDMLPLGIKGDVVPTTSSVRVWVKSVGVAAGAFDPLYANVSVFR
jgi:hypothetical protein